MQKTIEVFSAGCPLCTEATAQVREITGDQELRITDVRTPEGLARAKQMGVGRVPAVAVNGTLASCCQAEPVRVEAVRANLDASSR